MGANNGNPYLSVASGHHVNRSWTVAGGPAVYSSGSKCCYDDVVHALRQSSNAMYPSDDHNEVFPGIVIGSGPYARRMDFLRRDGITHVLNVSQGSHHFADADLSPSYYRLSNIQYMGADIVDMQYFDLRPHFAQCSAFIDSALSSNGKVLVHCMHGISRSGTIVLAYLIMHKGIPLLDAVNIVRKKRPIVPNPGFIQQLVRLNNEIFR